MYSIYLVSLLFWLVHTSRPVPAYSTSLHPTSYEISGRIHGAYRGKIYLFFENQYWQQDSLSADITGGHFHFSGTVEMPILARLHLDQHSIIADFFMDGPSITIDCVNKITVSRNAHQSPDTLNNLRIVDIQGSPMETLKSNFQRWQTELETSRRSGSQKARLYADSLALFVRHHPSSLVSPYLVGSAFTLRYSQVKEIADLIDHSLDSTVEGKSVVYILNKLSKDKELMTGALFHDVVLSDTMDRQFDTRRLRGKVVLLEFWASWCKPCRAANPSLIALYLRHQHDNFRIVGISWDKDREKWKKAIIHDRLPWYQVVDAGEDGGQLAKIYAIDAIPYNILLDKNGHILGSNLSNARIEAFLKVK